MYFHLEQKSFCMPLVYSNDYFGTDMGKWLVDLHVPIVSVRVDLPIQVITFDHSVSFVFLFGYNQMFFLKIQDCFHSKYFMFTIKLFCKYNI